MTIQYDCSIRDNTRTIKLLLHLLDCNNLSCSAFGKQRILIHLDSSKHDEPTCLLLHRLEYTTISSISQCFCDLVSIHGCEFPQRFECVMSVFVSIESERVKAHANCALWH